MTKLTPGSTSRFTALILLFAGLLLFAQPSFGRSDWIEFHAMSVAVEPSSGLTDDGTRIYLGFSLSGNFPPDNEITKLHPDGDFPFGGYLVLQPTNSLKELVWQFGTSLPISKDDNGNRIPDFFDWEETENGETFGLYIVELDDGSLEERGIIGTWTRSAKSAFGTVEFLLPDENNLVVTHRYRIIQWEGDYTYSVQDKIITGTVVLSRPDDSSLKLTGTMQMKVINSSEIAFESATLVTPDGTSVNFGPPEPGSIGQNGIYFTGPAVCSDGRPETPNTDFNTFTLIVEGIDRDGDGDADITEEDPPNPNMQPRLRAELTENGIKLTATGQSGARYMIQKATRLPQPIWEDVQFITLDGTIRSIELPITGEVGFFRLRL